MDNNPFANLFNLEGVTELSTPWPQQKPSRPPSRRPEPRLKLQRRAIMSNESLSSTKTAINGEPKRPASMTRLPSRAPPQSHSTVHRPGSRTVRFKKAHRPQTLHSPAPSLFFNGSSIPPASPLSSFGALAPSPPDPRKFVVNVHDASDSTAKDSVVRNGKRGFRDFSEADDGSSMYSTGTRATTVDENSLIGAPLRHSYIPIPTPQRARRKSFNFFEDDIRSKTPPLKVRQSDIAHSTRGRRPSSTATSQSTSSNLPPPTKIRSRSLSTCGEQARDAGDVQPKQDTEPPVASLKLQIQETSEQLQKAELSIDILRKKIESLQSDLSDSQRKTESTQHELQICNDINNKLSNDLKAKSTALDEVLLQKDALKDAKELFERRSVELNGQINAIRGANKELQTLMSSQIIDLESTRDALKGQIEALEGQLANKTLEIEKVSAALSQALTDKEEQDAELRSLQKQADSSEEMISTLTESRKTIETEKNELRLSLSALEAENSTLSCRVEELETTNRHSAANLIDLQAKRSLLETENKNMYRKLKDARLEIKTVLGGIKCLKCCVADATIDLRQSQISMQDVLSPNQEDCSMPLEQKTSAADNTDDNGMEGEGIDPTARLTNQNSAKETEKGAARVHNYEHLQAQHKELLDQHTTLEKKHTILQNDYAALQDEHKVLLREGEKKDQAMNETASQLAKLEEEIAELKLFRDEHGMLTGKLAGANSQAEQLSLAYNASQAEVASLQEQVARLRSARATSDNAFSTTSSKKQSRKFKDELVIVRNSADRGRIQIMKKSDLHRSRSPSRCSHRTDDETDIK